MEQRLPVGTDSKFEGRRHAKLVRRDIKFAAARAAPQRCKGVCQLAALPGRSDAGAKRPKGRPRTGSNSLRIDIPKTEIPEEMQRKEGVDYFDADDDRFADRRPADKLFNEIFGKAGK